MDLILRVVLVYVVVLLTLRLTTRKIMRSSTPLDMVVIFLVGGIAVQASLAGDQSITGSFLGIGTVAAVHMLITLAKANWAIVGRVSDGTPVVLFSQGQWAENEMRNLGLQKQDVFAEMRQNGHKSIDEVESAVLEHNGAITLLARK